MRRLVLLALLSGLVGCARSYEPIVDMQGVDAVQYQQDLEACRAYAEQVNVGGEAATGTGIGAVFGSALGAIAGAFGGEAGKGAALGASLGGVTGGAKGTASGVQGQHQVIANCLRHRGYAVLR
jgi:outer membrane lipoprotein SlyB